MTAETGQVLGVLIPEKLKIASDIKKPVIHRYTISRLRREIEPVSVADYMNFLFEWQGLLDKGEGIESGCSRCA